LVFGFRHFFSLTTHFFRFCSVFSSFLHFFSLANTPSLAHSLSYNEINIRYTIYHNLSYLSVLSIMSRMSGYEDEYAMKCFEYEMMDRYGCRDNFNFNNYHLYARDENYHMGSRNRHTDAGDNQNVGEVSTDKRSCDDQMDSFFQFSSHIPFFFFLIVVILMLCYDMYA
jgi:hypothetical protein